MTEYTTEELAAIAERTAQQFGCTATRWWRDPKNPRIVACCHPHALGWRVAGGSAEKIPLSRHVR
jgi:hypothetical protein